MKIFNKARMREKINLKRCEMIQSYGAHTFVCIPWIFILDDGKLWRRKNASFRSHNNNGVIKSLAFSWHWHNLTNEWIYCECGRPWNCWKWTDFAIRAIHILLWCQSGSIVSVYAWSTPCSLHCSIFMRNSSHFLLSSSFLCFRMFASCFWYCSLWPKRTRKLTT